MRRVVGYGAISLLMEDAFRAWDEDKDGKLSPQDIQAVLQRAGLPHDPEHVRLMMEGLDPDHVGYVSLEAFMEACARKGQRGPHSRPEDVASALFEQLNRKKHQNNK